ncbi:MAG: hypothetical protein J0L75_02365 [Spirochaetes bacterium]|nr:hypothetical protein [Spirochaetota bacterium]
MLLFLLTACQPSATIPTWAQGYPPNDFARLKEVISGLPGLKADFDLGIASKDGEKVDLRVLTEICYFNEPEEWGSLAAKWLEDSIAVEALLRSTPVAFSKLAPRIVLSLQPDPGSNRGSASALPTEIPGLQARFALDFGSWLRPLSPEEVLSLRQSRETLLALAERQTRDRLRQSIQVQYEELASTIKNAGLKRVTGKTPLTPSVLLFPDLLPGYQPQRMAIWGVPNTRSVMFAVIDGIGGIFGATAIAESDARSPRNTPGVVRRGLLLSVPDSRQAWVALSYRTNRDGFPELLYPSDFTNRLKPLLR